LTKCFDPNFSLSYLGVVPLYDDVFVFTGLRGNRGYLQLSKIFTSYLYDKTMRYLWWSRYTQNKTD